MYKLFIIEDDAGIADAIRRQAELWGLEVRCVQDFRNVLGEFAAFEPHIVLLDITLTFFNGYHWCGSCAGIPASPSFSSRPPRTT